MGNDLKQMLHRRHLKRSEAANDGVILHGLEMPAIMQIESPRKEDANHDKKKLRVHKIKRNNFDRQRILRKESCISSLHRREKDDA